MTFVDYDGTTVLDTQTVYDEDGALDPVTSGRIPTPARASTEQYTYTWSGWNKSFASITADTTVTATYTSQTRTYTVTFMLDAETTLQVVQNVPYNSTAVYTGPAPTKSDVEDPENYVHAGWTPSNANIAADTTCYPVFAYMPGFGDGYGVLWNYSQPGTRLNRIGLATSLADPVPATSLAGSGSSPFDSIQPWAGMKRYNIIDGQVSYSEDDAGFSETEYDTVVYIPEFWFKVVKDTTNKFHAWAISPTAQDGYTKHPGSGRYIGRFHTSGSSAGVYSKSGASPLGSTTRANFRTYSHNKGEKWWQLDIATWSALQMLYLVEFADWNSQSVLGKGFGSSSQKTGASTGAAYHTINGGNTYNQYRWVEQPFGRVYNFVDGYVASSKASYISLDNASFGDTWTGHTTAGVTLPSSGYITEMGLSSNFPWAFIPKTSGGTATTYVSDHVASGAGTAVLNVGGVFSSGDSYGFFCFYANNSASYTNAYLGSRLIFIP